MWTVLTTDDFDEWFKDIGEEGQAEVIAKVNLLKVLGPQLPRPHADTLNGSKFANLKELRSSTRDGVLRVAFAFDPNRSAILLVGGDKAGVNEQRFYKQLIARADKLFESHLAKIRAQKKKGKGR